MEAVLDRKIELDNRLTLVVSDLSRAISADACIVIMKASIDIKIEKELFIDTQLSEFKYNDILATLGDSVTWAYKIERNFIMNPEKEVVFEALVKTFLDNMGPYVARFNFPEKFILKAYADTLKQKERCQRR
jgi:hypothetical protein